MPDPAGRTGTGFTGETGNGGDPYASRPSAHRAALRKGTAPFSQAGGPPPDGSGAGGCDRGVFPRSIDSAAGFCAISQPADRRLRRGSLQPGYSALDAKRQLPGHPDPPCIGRTLLCFCASASVRKPSASAGRGAARCGEDKPAAGADPHSFRAGTSRRRCGRTRGALGGGRGRDGL